MSHESTSEHSTSRGPHLAPLETALRSRGIKVHYTTWLRMIRSKGLPAKKVGGRYYVDLDELDRWIAAQSVNPTIESGRGEAPSVMSEASADAFLAARRLVGRGPRRRRGKRQT
jgi:excisionase family DNA binding protein